MSRYLITLSLVTGFIFISSSASLASPGAKKLKGPKLDVATKFEYACSKDTAKKPRYCWHAALDPDSPSCTNVRKSCEAQGGEFALTASCPDYSHNSNGSDRVQMSSDPEMVCTLFRPGLPSSAQATENVCHQLMDLALGSDSSGKTDPSLDSSIQGAVAVALQVYFDSHPHESTLSCTGAPVGQNANANIKAVRNDSGFRYQFTPATGQAKTYALPDASNAQ